MKQVFGTDVLSGLNVAVAGHKLSASELRVSENGWTDESGSWKCARGPETLYTGYTSISALSAGRMGGADHVVWLDGTDLYDNGSDVGDITTSSPVIKDFDDRFFILGSTDSKNYVWDGTLLRQQGAPQIVDEWYDEYGILVSAGSATTIVGISNASAAVLTFGSAHGLVEGDCVYITGCTGMTEINGSSYTVTASTTLTATIDVNSTDFGTYSASSGSAYFDACGLTGDYKWYVTAFVRLADGTVIEGNPYGLGDQSQVGGWPVESGANVYTVSPTDKVRINAQTNQIVAGAWLDYVIGGTGGGVDWTGGIRIYRTKTGGADFYLESEITTSAPYYSRGRDQELGAVFPVGLYDRTSPPASSVMALAGQRLWMNDTSNPNRVYFTSLESLDYVPTLNYLTFPDTVTAIGSAGDVVVVFSCDRMWRVSLLGGVPDVDEIRTRVGTTYGNALALTDRGLLFLRDDGLWATDGASPPTKVSRAAFSEIASPAYVTRYGDTLLVGGSEYAYVLLDVDGGSVWHEVSVPFTMVDASNGVFYAADGNSVYSLFTGGYQSGALESPDLTNGAEMRAVRVVVDLDGDATPAVFVNGNRYSDYAGHTDTGTGRRIEWYPIPRLLNHVFNVRIEVSGGTTVYGYWLECEA